VTPEQFETVTDGELVAQHFWLVELLLLCILHSKLALKLELSFISILLQGEVCDCNAVILFLYDSFDYKFFWW